MQVGLHVGIYAGLNESESMQQVMQLPKGIVCLHSIIKQNDLITPENRLYDDGSAAASSIT